MEGIKKNTSFCIYLFFLVMPVKRRPMPIKKNNGNVITIIAIPVQPSSKIKPMIKLTSTANNGAITNIVTIPQIIFLFIDFPLPSRKPMYNPTIKSNKTMTNCTNNSDPNQQNPL